MKKFLYLLILPVLMLSCEKYPMPGSETLESFNYMIIGNNQSAESGQYLEAEIGVQVMLESLIPPSTQKFHIELEVLKGGGILDKTTIEAVNDGKMLTRWKLGNEENQQTVRGTIYDADGRYYSEFTINANAFFPEKWNTITKGFLVGIQDMVRDTVNKRSMLLSGRDIYISKNKFYDWQKIYFSNNVTLKELEINSKGEVFGGGWDGNLYKTSDWGQNWSLVSKPIPGNIYHFELSVTKEDYIWSNKWDYGVYCSKDNGLTWTKDSVGLENQEQLGRVFSYIGNSHLALSQSKLVILQTLDNGKTWRPIPTPEYSLTMFVTDENEIIAQNQGGFNLHKSSDLGKTYKKVFSPNVAFGTTSWHCYDKFKNYYYVLAPGGGVWKTKDFEEFEKLITFSLQRNLFIDHTGTIYASGFNYANATPDPTLVLPGNN